MSGTSDAHVLDASLVASFADRGDHAAFEQLVARHATLVFAVCRGVLGRHHDAEDAAQATFLTLARRASSLRAHPSIAGWLHCVAWHVATRAREARTLRTARERAAVAAAALDVPAEASDPGDASAELLLHELIAGLPEKLRVPIVLHHLEGWSEAESAAVLGARVGTVSGWLHRGRKRLKDELRRRGVAPAAFPMAPGATWLSVDAADASLVRSLASTACRAGVAGVRPMVMGLSNAAVQMLRGATLRRWGIAVGVLAAVGTAVWVYFAGPTGTPGTPAAVVAADDVRATGWIRGSVTGPSGGAVRGGHVYVYLRAADADARRDRAGYARTDAEGAFALADLPPAERYFVVVGIPYAGNGPPPPADGFRTRADGSAPTQVQHVVFRAD